MNKILIEQSLFLNEGKIKEKLKEKSAKDLRKKLEKKFNANYLNYEFYKDDMKFLKDFVNDYKNSKNKDSMGRTLHSMLLSRVQTLYRFEYAYHLQFSVEGSLSALNSDEDSFRYVLVRVFNELRNERGYKELISVCKEASSIAKKYYPKMNFKEDYKSKNKFLGTPVEKKAHEKALKDSLEKYLFNYR